VPSTANADHNPLWDSQGGQCAFPSATQNEINVTDAQQPARERLLRRRRGREHADDDRRRREVPRSEDPLRPGQGRERRWRGHVSGLEMSQNSMRMGWTREEVDAKLQSIMTNIYKQSAAAAKRIERPDNLKDGANIAGFIKVADAMFAQGCV
jgi:glutamate dehydrogenase (NADP+)